MVSGFGRPRGPPDRERHLPPDGWHRAEETLSAPAFVDASYEGDLAQKAGATMVVGRESRAQYGEPHAGKIFTKMRPVPNPKLFTELGLDVGLFALESNEILPGSTGEADDAVQAYNFRVCWTRDPANRLPVPKPARYERDIYLELESRWRFTNRVPNAKTSWNAPLLIGGNRAYPAGDWAARDEITARHRDLALGLLWFLQNDAVVPAGIRAEASQWGLPKDEFADNGGFPWEMYVREARRLVGRKVFTQADGMAAPGLERAPVQADSIAITEWPLDSHSLH
ncbi:MAG: FAD-dependent oxidoreductase, partial [Lacunisphaera sp.]